MRRRALAARVRRIEGALNVFRAVFPAVVLRAVRFVLVRLVRVRRVPVRFAAALRRTGFLGRLCAVLARLCADRRECV